MVKKTERPYLLRIVKSDGRVYWYFRKNGKRTPLPGNPDSPEFDQAYWACRSGRAQSPSHTFDELITSYRASPAFQNLRFSTRKDYERTLLLISEKNGKKDFRNLRRKDVIAARDKFSEQWRKANAFVEMLSILSRHAMNLEWIDRNPASGVEKLKGGSYEAWPDWALTAFEKEAEGHALTAFQLAIGTGQRLSDLCLMEWDHYDGEGIQVVQSKTGARLWVACPAKLKAYLDSQPKTGRFILARNLTQPLSKSQVQKAVSVVREKIGAKRFVIHGWRYTAARQLAEAGATDSEIQAVTGHKTLEMVQKYRAQACQKRLSRTAQARRK